MVQHSTEDTEEFRGVWNKLYDDLQENYTSYVISEDVRSNNTNKQQLSSSSVGSKVAKEYLHEPLKKTLGLRPICPILNLLLDAISMKFAELEKGVDLNDDTRFSHTTSIQPGEKSNLSTGGGDLQEMYTTNDGSDSTDDEDAFFKSPSVMSYRLKSLDRISPVKLPSVNERNIMDEATQLHPKLLVTPKKRDANHTPSSSSRMENDKHIRPKLHLKPEPKQLLVTSSEHTENDENDFFEQSVITLDATPPPLTKHSRRTKLAQEQERKDLLEETVSSLDAATPLVAQSFTGSNPAFVITSKMKKEVWLDPDAVSSSRSQHKKRFKQTNLLSLARNIPTKKMDLTKLNNYNGGNRLPSQPTNDSCLENGPSNATLAGTKRKSDDSVEGDGNRNKIESTSRSQTCMDFGNSSLSQRDAHSSPPLKSPVPHTSVENKPRSPLSPGKLNIIEEPSRSRPSGSKSHYDSTYNLLKDFDKVPVNTTPKLSRNKTKKKQEWSNAPVPVCCCPPSSAELEELKDLVHPTEFEKECPIHTSGPSTPPPVIFNTPVNFWCTPQYTTQELYDQGRIRVASTPFTPAFRRRRMENTDQTFYDTENNAEL